MESWLLERFKERLSREHTRTRLPWGGYCEHEKKVNIRAGEEEWVSYRQLESTVTEAWKSVQPVDSQFWMVSGGCVSVTRVPAYMKRERVYKSELWVTNLTKPTPP